MTIITIEEMQKNLRDVLDKVQAGETLVVYEDSRPVAEIKAVSPETPRELRPFGLCAGLFTVPDDFDEALPEDLLETFEGR